MPCAGNWGGESSCGRQVGTLSGRQPHAVRDQGKHNRRCSMKSQDIKKDAKKQPKKTLKEKRQEKKAKKAKTI
jgi:hypothetical protein